MSAATADVGAFRRGGWMSGVDLLILARRNLLHIRSDPEQLVGMTVQPLMFLLLFVYVFGGAIAGSSKRYLEFALPGILVQGTVFSGIQTALGLSTDFGRGLIDRFRSLPMSRSAVVGGRVAADGLRVVWGTIVLGGFGVLLGFRFHGSFLEALAAFALVIGFGVAVCWPMALIGMSLKTAESVQTAAFLIVLPLTFASSVFAPPQTMPAGLRAFVKVNPITALVDATRALMLGTPAGSSVWRSVAWIAGIFLVFVPLAVARYRRRA